MVARRAGRRVPVRVAVVPGMWAAVLIVRAGLRVLAWTIVGDARLTSDDWGAGAPVLFWLPWGGVAVGAATYAYALHRRVAATR